MNPGRSRSGEVLMEKVFLACALTAVLAVFLIVGFLFAKGLPLIIKVGPAHFLGSVVWDPLRGRFGIASMIVGSLAVTLGALLWSVPLGIALAIFLGEVANPRLGKIMASLVELLAGIPSVVYGFFGLVIIVPWIRDHLGGSGYSIMAAALILGVMILPTIVAIARDAIMQVPSEYKEGSLALGANRWQTIAGIILPAARPGIIAGVVLGMGRAFGETMAVLMVTGNVTRMPESLLSPVRTMTSNVVLEMGYAAGDHQLALFATGMVLFLFVLAANMAVWFVFKGEKEA